MKYFNTITKRQTSVYVDDNTTISSTDSRVSIFFEKVDLIKYSRSFDSNNLPTILEYELDTDGKRYTDYLLDVATGIMVPNYTKIEDKVLLITQSEFRAERDKLLIGVDIDINIALDTGFDVVALRTYRQALRDATLTWIMPTL